MRNWLKYKRIEKNLTQKEIAIKTGVSQQSIQLYENGKRRPSPDIAIKLGKVLDFDWTWFFSNSSSI